ncbi:hypothetical protein EMIT0P12_20744 [Pseudomonas sp. IT-P12]
MSDRIGYRQKPKEVDRAYSQRYRQVPSISTRGKLVGMTAMSLIDFVAAQQSTNQRERRIDYEHTQQYHPGPEQVRGLPSGL